MPHFIASRCRIFSFLDHDGQWTATCRTHGHIVTGDPAYVGWLVAIHRGNNPA